MGGEGSPPPAPTRLHSAQGTRTQRAYPRTRDCLARGSLLSGGDGGRRPQAAHRRSPLGRRRGTRSAFAFRRSRRRHCCRSTNLRSTTAISTRTCRARTAPAVAAGVCGWVWGEKERRKLKGRLGSQSATCRCFDGAWFKRNYEPPCTSNPGAAPGRCSGSSRKMLRTWVPTSPVAATHTSPRAARPRLNHSATLRTSVRRRIAARTAWRMRRRPSHRAARRAQVRP